MQQTDPRPQAGRRADDQRFEALARASSSGVYRMNADWSQLVSMSGGSFLESSSSPVGDYLARYALPEDREAIQEAIRSAVARGEAFELEHRIRRGDGSIAWTLSRAVPLRDGRGQITEWIGIATDISDRKLAQDELARQKRLYEAILDNTPDLAYIWNLEHRFIYANKGLLRMWGRSWDEAIGRNCLELGYEPWHAEMHDREIEQVVATGKPVRGEVPFTGTFGRRIYDYLLVPVFGEDGRVEAVAGTTRDVTESQQLQASLIEADRRKDEFLATLGHELRNPLAPICNAIRLLQTAQLPLDRQAELHAMIARQAAHLARLVDDLLDVSRITRGHINLQKSRVNLRQVLTDAIEAAMPAIEARRHVFTLECAQVLPPVTGDATRLAQVFQNLLDNAAKYTPPGGRITVKVTTGERELSVVVRDNGIGIPPRDLGRVFELFARLGESQTTKVSGLGIGLALARQLVRLHGGRMEVRSEGEGKGSEFLVVLPLASAA